MTENQKTTLGFQAEVSQLLQLMIHSLYSHKEIFLRELISNASDANDRLRFEAIANPALLADDTALSVWVEGDPAHKTLTVRDNGIGMSREEAIANLGTIARSGTAEFFKSLSGDQQKDSQLIGQFGVGFYSAFIVAERVEVLTRKAGAAAAAGVHWESSADGQFTVETVDLPERGTTIILHLKDDTQEFADSWRLRSLIHRYSDHLSFPVLMRKEAPPKADKDETAPAPQPFEAVNQARALWTRPRSEVSDAEYKQFFEHIAHDPTEPLAWSHNKVEGKRDYTSLLYVPGRAPFDLWHRDAARGLKLYVRRVFIMDDAEQFLPLYLRFIKGVIDSSDLPLNVSRELLQQDADVEAMKGGLTRRVLELLTKLASEEPAKYATFWKEFGAVLKEGLAEDYANREKILPLLRFASTHAGEDTPTVSLKDYVGRMKSGQERIYFVIADSIAAARSSPHIEQLKALGIEVLLMSERVDEWVMGQVEGFEGKSFKDAARGDLELGTLAPESERAKAQEQLKEHEDLLKRVKAALGERVTEVRIASRLTDSPSCLVMGERDLGSAMRRILEAQGQKLPDTKPVLELNVEHPIVRHLEAGRDEASFTELAQLLYDQAALSEGGQLVNPADYVRRLNRLLVRLAVPGSA
ncbi:MAG TPA: molecular chaperone HtpG [Steroidobacteraceae bacterium]|jgi:molecular chaperone HtpG|nr:molecular chaperone HtpG [Steroidobacteraceae bacterium]